MVFRQKTNKPTVRCIAINDIFQADNVGQKLKEGNVLILYTKELKICKPLEYKRLIGNLKAYCKEYNSAISKIGGNFILLVPKTHELILHE